MIVGDREERLTGRDSTAFEYCNRYLWAISSFNRFSCHLNAESSSIDRFQLYVHVKNNSHSALITNKVTNSSAKRHALHQISPPYSWSSTAFASPTIPQPPLDIQSQYTTFPNACWLQSRRTRKKGLNQVDRGRCHSREPGPVIPDSTLRDLPQSLCPTSTEIPSSPFPEFPELLHN